MYRYLRLAFIRKRRHGRRQDLIVSRFTAHRRTHDHKPVTDLNSIIQLYYFIHKGFRRLKVPLLRLVGDLFQKFTIINRRLYDARE